MRRARQLLVLLVAVLAFAGTAVTPAHAAGDDYPWRTDTTWTADRWGFTKRQCVSFAAWRLAQRGTPIDNARQRWGSALSWDDTARRRGHGISPHPRVGAIAQWNAGESAPLYVNGSPRPNATMRAGAYGHVGWVKGIYPDGSVSLEQYNGTGTRTFSTIRVRAPRYLYVGV